MNGVGFFISWYPVTHGFSFSFAFTPAEALGISHFTWRYKWGISFHTLANSEISAHYFKAKECIHNYRFSGNQRRYLWDGLWAAFTVPSSFWAVSGYGDIIPTHYFWNLEFSDMARGVQFQFGLSCWSRRATLAEAVMSLNWWRCSHNVTSPTSQLTGRVSRGRTWASVLVILVFSRGRQQQG